MQDDFRLILIDDSVSDARIVERALREARLAHKLTHYPGGREALAALSAWCHSPTREASQPHLILLDLNLPGLNGLEILAELKTHDTLRVLPVVMLSSSLRHQEVAHAYRLGTNAYIQKPGEFDAYLTLVQTLHRFWQVTSVPPPTPDL